MRRKDSFLKETDVGVSFGASALCLNQYMCSQVGVHLPALSVISFVVFKEELFMAKKVVGNFNYLPYCFSFCTC